MGCSPSSRWRRSTPPSVATALQAAGLLDAEREALGNQAVDRWAERELAVNG